MQKNLKKDLEVKYIDIFKKLYTQWNLQGKKKYEELQNKGIANSGILVNAMYLKIEELINNAISEIQQLLVDLPNKYNRKLSFDELNEYKEKSIETIEGHINSMEKDVKEKYSKESLCIAESNIIFINNLKYNARNRIEKNFEEIVNLRKGKKVDWLVILSFLITVASLIVGIIALF